MKWHIFGPVFDLYLPVFILLPFSKIVDRIDGDADGYITTAELKAWIKRVQKRYVYENVAKVWTDYDLNKDNKISWDEYKQATYGYYLGMYVCVCVLWIFFLHTILKYNTGVYTPHGSLILIPPLSQPGGV